MTINLLDVVGDCDLVGGGLGLELGGETVVGWDWDLGGLKLGLGKKKLGNFFTKSSIIP